jgi:hypothetical protein
MTTYLDKEAVLKELTERAQRYQDAGDFGYCCAINCLKINIEHEDFDAKTTSPEYWRTCMAEKDVEIAQLTKHRDDLIGAVKFAKEMNDKLKLQRNGVAASREKALDRIAQYEKDQRGMISEILSHKGRIVDLEKLCDMQKAAIDRQGKALRAYNKFRQELPSVDPARIVITTKDAVKEFYAFENIIEQPVPQPSPVPTSGTGTAPEGATVEQIRPDDDPPIFKASSLAILRISTLEDVQYQNHKRIKKLEGRTYPGMAKDIGDLTLRVDNLKIASEAHEQIFRAHGKMIQDLQQKRLMDDSRGNTFEGQIDRLETALKALQEEVKGTAITGENGTIYSLKVKRVL